MSQDNIGFYNTAEELDEDLNINLEKIWKTIWYRKSLLIKIFCSVLIFFILLTFIIPKKYKVTADLYVNKSNSSNMVEVNPYFLDEASGPSLSMGVDKAINNEIELMKSELVLDKVIRDNNIVYRKKYGIIPNKKEGELLSAEDFYKKGKILKLDNIKNTNVITIEYKSKKPELAYGVVSSLITHYIELHKELNAEKSKSDKELIEAEYAKTKEMLDEKIKQASGLPAQAMSGVGNISAMSAFSNSASRAIGNIKSQYIAGERSHIAVNEESQKLAQLSAKLEWAKMVEQMSDSSKVLVLKEPKKLRSFEKCSPKLLMNIILGCIFGGLASLIALINAEMKDEKLTYSALSNNIIYDGIKNLDSFKLEIMGCYPKKVLLISLVQLQQEIINEIQKLPNVKVLYPDVTKEFMSEITSADEIVFVSKIRVTDSDLYKNIKKIIEKHNKKILCDILV